MVCAFTRAPRGSIFGSQEERRIPLSELLATATAP